MNNYLVEFLEEPESLSTVIEGVLAINMEEAIYSIKTGWPDCKIVAVYLDLNYSEDEDTNVE